MRAVYKPHRPPGFWGEFFLLARTVYGILLWPMLVLIGALIALAGIVVLFTIHWGFALLALAAIVVAVVIFAWWETHRFGPPEG